MGDLVVVAGEALWPEDHGGRIRTARLAEALSRRFDVWVAAPAGAPPPSGLGFVELPADDPVRSLASAASPRPRLGQAMLGPRRRAALAESVSRLRPAAVLFAHSYLAAVAPHLAVPSAVDFADVEVRRLSSLARRGSARNRAATALEWAKARSWEPPVARRARLALAVTASDAELLGSWGASVLLVPHGSHPHRYRPSPTEGPVTFVASLDYPPNRDAARFLLDRVWPRVRAEEPAVGLRIVGRAASEVVGWTGERDGVEVVSDPATVERYYREASVLLAPVRTGGGAQVKVVEALGRCRVIVATRFSARSAPPTAGEAVVTADDAATFAAQMVRLWREAKARRAAEAVLAARRPVPGWEEVCRPVADALEGIVERECDRRRST